MSVLRLLNKQAQSFKNCIDFSRVLQYTLINTTCFSTNKTFFARCTMTTQALLQLSADIITRYYNNEIEPFLAACHPDVLWIGPANTQIIRTRETLIETFAEEHHNLRFEMHDLVTVPLMTPSSKVLEVLLFYDVDTIWPDNSMQRVKQRVQLSWVVEGGQPFIRVCHVSNALDYDDRDVIYPVHYGEDRVRVAVLSGEDRAPRIVLKGANKAMLYLRPAYIDYLETSGMHTYIHTQNDIRESTERLTAIDKRYPGLFLRCHESYLVNPDRVTEITRFHLTLINGTTLPIPEKKYTAVKKRLSEMLAKEK